MTWWVASGKSITKQTERRDEKKGSENLQIKDSNGKKLGEGGFGGVFLADRLKKKTDGKRGGGLIVGTKGDSG